MAEALQLSLDVHNYDLDLAVEDRPLGACLDYAGGKLIAVELFSSAVALGHQQRCALNALVGGEAETASGAFPATTNAIVGGAGIGHLGVRTTTVRALQSILYHFLMNSKTLIKPTISCTT